MEAREARNHTLKGHRSTVGGTKQRRPDARWQLARVRLRRPTLEAESAPCVPVAPQPSVNWRLHQRCDDAEDDEGELSLIHGNSRRRSCSNHPRSRSKNIRHQWKLILARRGPMRAGRPLPRGMRGERPGSRSRLTLRLVFPLAFGAIASAGSRELPAAPRLADFGSSESRRWPRMPGTAGSLPRSAG